MYSQFLNELSSGKFLLADRSYIDSMMTFLASSGVKTAAVKPEIKLLAAGGAASQTLAESRLQENSFDSAAKNSIAVIPVSGTMFKNDSWYSFGMDYIASLIRQACESDSISGIILMLNTPGGSTLSVIRLEEALRSRTKPLVAVVDGLCCSAGIYIASFADRIVALNRMCEIGSIGTFCIIDDFSGYYKKLGIREHHIYPPESSFKNKGYRDVIENGDDKYIIQSELSPYALHFQETVRQNRPNLKTETEGILEGKVFYAYDALDNGLIDGIMNFAGAIALVRSLVEQKKTLASLF